MRHIKSHSVALQQAQLALRIAVCRHCRWRPPGTGSLGADVPRACEGRCELFTRLSPLLRTAECVDPTIASFERAVSVRIKDLCATDREARGDCEGAADGACPLSRYRREITRALGNVVAN